MSEVNPRPTWFLNNASVWTVENDLRRAEMSGQCVLSKGILEADTRLIPDAQTVTALS